MIFGFDSNCFHKLMQAIIHDIDCSSREIYNIIKEVGHIGADDDEFILNEWRTTSGANSNLYIASWISDRLLDGGIRLYPAKKLTEIKKDLVNNGLPQKDAKFAAILIKIGSNYFFSCDIDFFDPRRKDSCNDKQFRNLVLGRKGKLCRYLEKKYRLSVFHLECFAEIRELLN